VVLIANYRGRAIDALTVTLRAPGEFREVRAARAGALTATRRGEMVSVTLPVDWADLVTFRR
jgi:hypothetical protein